MKKTLLDKDWLFVKTDKGGEIPAEVKLPHDYAITSKRSASSMAGASDGYYHGGGGKYSRFLEFPEKNHAILQVDGAFAASRVYFNRDLCEFHPHGYAPYLTDLTPYIVPEVPNKLVITTDDSFYSRWYSGAGLYRDVFLWTGGDVRIEPRDYFAHTFKITKKGAAVKCEATLSCDRAFEGYVSFSLSMPKSNKESSHIKAHGTVSESGYYEENLQETLCTVPVSLTKACKKRIKFSCNVKNPRCWSPDTPFLYNACLKVCEKEGTVLDTNEWKFGIRTIEISAEKGLLLNGNPLKLRGGCIHHDHGGIGAVSLPAAEERKIMKLKEVGYNAIRSSHNPPSTALLETCDRLGMILMDEIFDMWMQPKKRYDYSLFFQDRWQEDTANMVKRDRNHACVLSYSCGNEVHERDERWGGAKICENIATEIRRHDSTRPVTLCINGISGLPQFTAGDGEAYADLSAGAPVCDSEGTGKYVYKPEAYMKRTEKLLSCLDIVGYNYQFRRYEEIHEKYPERVFWGSETQVLHFYESWKKTVANPYILGDFTWVAWDNLGEAGCGGYMWEREGEIKGYGLGAYPWRTCFQGDFDLAGYRRPQSYFRRAIWEPDVELGLFTTHPEHTGEGFTGTGWHWFDVSPSWTYGDEWIGKDTVCEAYTTADKVEFYVNGRLLSTVEPVEAIARAILPYEPGILEAVAYRDGMRVSSAILETVSDPENIKVCAERKKFTADGRDLCYFDISLIDKAGRLICSAGNEISVSVTGGKLLSVFSGNPCNEDDYASGTCHLFCGRAVAVVSAACPGKVTLTVTSEGFESAVEVVLAK